MDNLAAVVQLLKKEQDRLTKELRGIGAALAAFGKAYGKQTGSRGRLSAAARARIAAAQRARWAKVRENAGGAKKVVPIRGKRTLSRSRTKEDRRRTEGAVGKGEGGEEDGLATQLSGDAYRPSSRSV